MDKLKTYLVEVVMKNVGTKVMSSLLSMAIVFIAAHQDIMEQIGITYYPDFNGTWSGAMPTGQLITIELATLKVWGAAALVAGATLVWGVIQHHAVATVTGFPQSGDKRITETLPIEGGERKGETK